MEQDKHEAITVAPHRKTRATVRNQRGRVITDSATPAIVTRADLRESAAWKGALALAEAANRVHEQYRNDFVIRGNDALRDILGGGYDVFLAFRAAGPEELVHSALRDYLRKERSAKTQKNSHLATLALQTVIGAERKTLHVYTCVYRAALADNVPPGALPQYLRDRGGVENVYAKFRGKDKDSKSEQTAREAAVVASMLKSEHWRPLAVLPQLSGGLPVHPDQTFFYLICTPGKVLGVAYPDPATERAMLQAFGEALIARADDWLFTSNKRFRRLLTLGTRSRITETWARRNGVLDKDMARRLAKGLLRGYEPGARR